MVGLVSLGRRREATLKGFFSHVLTEFEEILLFAYCGDIVDHVGKFCKPPACFINVRNLFFCKRVFFGEVALGVPSRSEFSVEHYPSRICVGTFPQKLSGGERICRSL